MNRTAAMQSGAGLASALESVLGFLESTLAVEVLQGGQPVEDLLGSLRRDVEELRSSWRDRLEMLKNALEEAELVDMDVLEMFVDFPPEELL